jgi:hypothetical protein
MKPLFVLACGLAATACSANAGNGVPTSTPDAQHMMVAEDAAQAPLLVRWQLLSDVGGRLKISAVVLRRTVLRVPIDVQIEVPPGLQVVSGSTRFRLEANLQPGESVATLEFAYSETPPGDLKLIADVSGPGMGVHATDAYRFGRPAPQPVRPQPSGPNNKVGNVDLGPAIQIDKK